MRRPSTVQFILAAKSPIGVVAQRIGLMPTRASAGGSLSQTPAVNGAEG
jgi:hypothetical protein